MAELKEMPVKEAPPELVDVRVDLPAHAGALIVDGRQYFHGFSYKVTPAQAVSFYDMMDKAWRHEKEVSGSRKPFDAYRRPV